MDEIINYRSLSEEEKTQLLSQLYDVGFHPASGGIEEMKREMDRSRGDALPQYVLVKNDGRLVGYMFLIAEQEQYCKPFPWWAVHNGDELPLNLDLRLLRYGVELCEKAGCRKLAERLSDEIRRHTSGIGRRPDYGDET